MIQREREEREKILATEEAQIRAKTAQDTAREKAYIQARESAGEENRRFLEELKIPERLQAIIDEEKLQGVYVFWWLQHPEFRKGYGQPHAYPKEIPVHDEEAEKRTGYVTYKKPFLTRVSLVWGIGYVEGFSRGITEQVDNEHGGYGYRTVGSGTFPDGYAFRAINVEGSAEEGLLIIHGATKIGKKHLDTSYYEGGKRFIDEYPPERHESNVVPGDTPLSSSQYFEITHSRNEIVLYRDQLNQPEVLERTLAPVYLDTLNWRGHFEVRGNSHTNSWPFDKQVPEQEQKSRGYARTFAVRISI